MKEINASIKIYEDSYEQIADAVYEYIEDRLKDDIESKIDLDIPMNDWMSENFNLRDWIDGDIDDYIDVESSAKYLLDNYNPMNACGTAESFTDAIVKALRYIFIVKEEDAKDILRSIDNFKKRQEAKEIMEKNDESLKSKYFAQFKKELEDLANANNNNQPENNPGIII